VISPEDLPHIFDRLQQGGKVSTRENVGAGLGLYITKRLVEAMGGTIDVRSEPGAGSTFKVEIPLDGSRSVPSPNGSRAGAARRDGDGAPLSPAAASSGRSATASPEA